MFTALGGFAMISLSRRWVVTTGTVISVDRERHRATTVRFSNGARTYEPELPGTGAHPGDQLTVYYDPRDPTRAATDEPGQALRYDLFMACMASLVLGTFASVLICRPGLYRCGQDSP
jgi:hypothetical protein